MEAQRNKAKRTWIFTGVLILLSVALLTWMVVRILKSRSSSETELPMPFGFGLCIISSGSMSPTLEAYDLAVIVPRQEYQVGDIVVFSDDIGLTIHRIIAVDGDQVTTKGDYEGNSPDHPIELSAIQGKMLFSVPRMGMFFEYVKRPRVIIAVICLALILLLISFQPEEKQHRRKNVGQDETPHAESQRLKEPKKEE